MKIAIYGLSGDNISKKIFLELLSIAKKHDIELVVEKEFSSIISNKNYSNKIFISHKDLDRTYDLMITIGGDGTLLRSITYVRDLGIPIMGINTGRLGFLATLKQEMLHSELNKILFGEYDIKERSLLEVSVNNKTNFSDFNYALNEVSVGRKNTTSMIEIKTVLDGEYLNTYWADGLIISTPTGSTGYSLSCGGPIMSPSSQTFSITPIAPHNLNARPLIISDETIIELSVKGREESHLLSLDSKIISLENNTVIKIKKASFKIKLASLQNISFYKTLRNKLLWGEDKRNA
ncbi:MAG: NAD kinase [Flavobacteriaceae bacterium]|jgi:NAD+ kinase|nr:MAG: NAD kinase [Flavobacteriales bacterium]